MTDRNFKELFSVSKPIIGMIHMEGHSSGDKLDRALEELEIYDAEGIDGAIIEDYHGREQDVYDALKLSSTMNLRIVRGVNLLKDPYKAFAMANEFDAKFVQFDSVQRADLDLTMYDAMRNAYPDISVLGGVGFKYQKATGNSLELDLNDGKSRCEAIVTTGPATGIETPLEKLKEYRRLLADFPLVVGAGVNMHNVGDQLMVSDGAIIGSYFKHNSKTRFRVERQKVRDLMSIVKDLRAALV